MSHSSNDIRHGSQQQQKRQQHQQRQQQQQQQAAVPGTRLTQAAQVSTQTAAPASGAKSATEPPLKRPRLSPRSSNSLPHRPRNDPGSFRPVIELTSIPLANEPNDMSDGSMSKRSAKTSTLANRESENEARALRVLEIMNDFRTLQVHITSLVTRTEANPPDQASYYLDGYVVLRQCNAEAQAILATHYNPGSLGLESGRVPDTEVQKATLQRWAEISKARESVLTTDRIILDASTRRFQAHKIYLRAAAGMRWVQLREQAMSGNLSPGKQAQALRSIDQRLREVCHSYHLGYHHDPRGSSSRSAKISTTVCTWAIDQPLHYHHDFPNMNAQVLTRSLHRNCLTSPTSRWLTTCDLPTVGRTTG